MSCALDELCRRLTGQVPPANGCDPESGADEGLVTGVRLHPDGRMEIRLLVRDYPEPDRLLAVERCIEESLGIPLADVVLCPAEPPALGQAVQAAARMKPWILRRLSIMQDMGALTALLHHADFVPEPDHVRIVVPDACQSAMASARLSDVLTTQCEASLSVRVPFRIQESDPRDTMEQAARILKEAELDARRNRPVPAPSDRTDAGGDPGRNGRTRSAGAHGGNGNGHGNGSANHPGKKEPRRLKQPETRIWGRMDPGAPVTAIRDLSPDSGLVTLEGETVLVEVRTLRNPSKCLVVLSIADETGAVHAKAFPKTEDARLLEARFKKPAQSRIHGKTYFDGVYDKDLLVDLVGIESRPEPETRRDRSGEGRVELHAHTRMSTRDAICDPRALVEMAASFGHPALAITDHGGVQAFPDVYAAAVHSREKGKPVAILYGLECYLADDGMAVAHDPDEMAPRRASDEAGDTGSLAVESADTDLPEGEDPPLQSIPCEEQAREPSDSFDRGFVALDLETTGLDASKDRIVEIGAVRFLPDRQGGFVQADVLSMFCDPGIPIPDEVTALTGIRQEQLEGAPSPGEALDRLLEFIGPLPVAAHNALFDLSFLRYEGFRSEPRKKVNPKMADTLQAGRAFLPDLPNHRLPTVAERLGIRVEASHRAADDARVCGEVLSHFLRMNGASSLSALNAAAGRIPREQVLRQSHPVHHAVLLARDPLGLYNLYRLVSISSTRYFHGRPRLPRSVLSYFRTGLLVGSACERGEVFQAILRLYRESGNDLDTARNHLSDRSVRHMARFYDYLEIMPIGNNAFLLRDPDSGLGSEEDLRNLNRLVLALGAQLRIPVCATGDVHFLDRKDAVYREILQTDMNYADASCQPDLSYRTTEEMLNEFAYLGRLKAEEVVLRNPLEIAGRIVPNLRPIPEGIFPPVIAEAPRQVEALTRSQAERMYAFRGVLPDLVATRIDRELTAIIRHGFAIMYYTAHVLVKTSNEDGYPVGSRGSVGSSLVATLCGISEVNPLPPHYRCGTCRHSEFVSDPSVKSGYDLPRKACPHCGTDLQRDGQDIPFETFLGFSGEKQPDIDLNFSGEYQGRAHRQVETLFGRDHTFRAGTITAYAEKNAAAIVSSYFEKLGRTATKADKARLARGIVGVKRTTGQHPGGIIVVPQDREVYDFTPVQHPADKVSCGILTTHFDFHSLHDTILKLDILGHFDPTMLKTLGDLTGIPVQEIPLPDEAVMSLFTSTEALRFADASLAPDCGTLGLPELGTLMARDMVRETRPSSFYDLVQLLGLSHGTDVWKGNAQDLIANGICSLHDVIGCRDSIMTGLIQYGLASKDAFDIMERVRKGKGLLEAQESAMRAAGVPEWYIVSCNKIKYMFPKAHAAAYAISALRIGWFKVHRPAAYYCAYFSVRGDDFRADTMIAPLHRIRGSREELQQRKYAWTDKDEKTFYLLEIIEEMMARGIAFLPPDLVKSDATRFMEEAPDRIRPPLTSLPGLGTHLAAAIVAARNERPFLSRDDLARRAGVGSSILNIMESTGALGDLPATSQLDFFSLLGG